MGIVENQMETTIVYWMLGSALRWGELLAQLRQELGPFPNQGSQN